MKKAQAKSYHWRLLSPIKSVKEKDEPKKAKPASVKTGLKKSVPDFTEPVFKPRKHDML